MENSAEKLSICDDKGSKNLKTRRWFLRLSKGAVLIGPGTTIAISVARERSKEAKDILARMFGARGSDHPIVVAPPLNHQNVSGPYEFSSSGKEVGSAYAASLCEAGSEITTLPRDVRIDDSCSIVVVGSRRANALAEMYLGKAYGNPEQKLWIKSPRNLWSAKVHWFFYTPPDAASRTVSQPRTNRWVSKDHVILGADFSSYKPDKRERDFLLVTIVPRFRPRKMSEPQRVVILEGLHRPGTLMAGTLFAGSPLNVLRQLEKGTSGEGYCQALFTARTFARNMESRPCEIQLVEARPLEVR